MRFFIEIFLIYNPSGSSLNIIENLFSEGITKTIESAKKNNIKIKGIITVGLFGQPCDMDEINKIAKKYKLWILDDSAQSFGAKYKNKPLGIFSDVSTTSFFPAKPLGCYGDAGALFTNNKKIFEIAYSSHLHGMGKDRYKYERIGLNGRMDSSQAGVLLEKLTIFQKELKQRQLVANHYISYFKKLNTKISLPIISSDKRSAWAQFTVILPKGINREYLQKKLLEKNIPTAIYYPIPLHEQKPYKKYILSKDNLENTVYLSKHVISLPMHPYLSKSNIKYICENFNKIISEMI